MSKILMVISNHPPEKWEDEQKKGWDVIEYIPFPSVPPEMDDVSDMAVVLLDQIKEKISSVLKADENNYFAKFYLCCQGDFSLTAEMVKLVIYSKLDHDSEIGRLNLIYPTTKRVVEEKDGVKTSIFKFVRWREVTIPYFK